MVYTMRYYKWIVNSLKSIYCKKYNSLYIPPNPNKTSTMARYAPTQYSSDTGSTLKNIKN